MAPNRTTLLLVALAVLNVAFLVWPHIANGHTYDVQCIPDGQPVEAALNARGADGDRLVAMRRVLNCGSGDAGFEVVWEHG